MSKIEGATVRGWGYPHREEGCGQVTSIFGKLGLEESPEAHRRVLAVIRFLDA